MDSFALGRFAGLRQMIRLRGAENRDRVYNPKWPSPWCSSVDHEDVATALDLDEGLEYLNQKKRATSSRKQRTQPWVKSSWMKSVLSITTIKTCGGPAARTRTRRQVQFRPVNPLDRGPQFPELGAILCRMPRRGEIRIRPAQNASGRHCDRSFG